MVRVSSAFEGSASPLLSRRRDTTFQTHLTATQLQMDALQSNFTEQASDASSLFAMVAGSFAYRLGNLGVLSLGARAPLLSRFAAPVIGLSAEVSAFRATQSLLSSSDSHLPSSSWLTDFVNFATLKSVGRWAHGQNFILAHALQDVGMVAGHQLAYALNLSSAPEGSLAQQLIHAEIMNLQMQAGMSLFGFATGNRFALLEQKLHLFSEAQAQRDAPNRFSFHDGAEANILSMSARRGKSKRGAGDQPSLFNQKYKPQGKPWTQELRQAAGNQPHQAIAVEGEAHEALLREGATRAPVIES